MSSPLRKGGSTEQINFGCVGVDRTRDDVEGADVGIPVNLARLSGPLFGWIC